MKKTLFAAAVLTLASCKKENKIPEADITPSSVPEVAAAATECYRAVLKQDTIMLTVDVKGNEVPSGKLTYNFFEKDKSDGTISGKMHGDTLFANYIFTAEGQTSQREVAFLKKGDAFIEGYGDITDDGKGNVTFKDKRTLRFDGNTVLQPVACDEKP
ncbi:hypothetical protein HYN48_11780 [Flavobacterium magnum]|uniref:Uncharacterized protein n=1 Tax=Flavobacterium magnum TaxID=2162713 RepID=A0A2S0RHW0_9FLAO|nr:hypothetical protein [Flavobacterium magnum]AWA30711.1 hypothetical protein HYN48_11780 [Flavobacterium magnum]